MPGVYWFQSKENEVLYVGKAKNLRNRLGSYVRVTPSEEKTYNLVTIAESVKYQTLESDLEAILVEAELIRAHQPYYNIDLKDDKSPLYIVITQDKYPRVITARKKELHSGIFNVSENNIFGPFATSRDARNILKVSRRIFKFCNASTSQKQANQPCFYTHLGLCSGACKGTVSESEYKESIKKLKLFLRGKRNSLVKNLRTQMNNHSTNLEFEKASMVRDQLQSLEKLYQVRMGTRFDEYVPILEEDTFAARLTQLNQILHKAGLTPLDYKLKRIEAYDISNIQGTATTASMVVTTNGRPDHSEYRHFTIRSVEGPNDFASMKEVIARRLNHPEWDYPQLLVIDGGKGQLRSVLSVVERSIPTISIAKNPDRIIIPRFTEAKVSYIIISLKPGHPVSQLIQQMRDEAHRFSRRLHHRLRKKISLQ